VKFHRPKCDGLATGGKPFRSIISGVGLSRLVQRLCEVYNSLPVKVANHRVYGRLDRTISTRSTVTTLACPPHSWSASIVRSTSGVTFSGIAGWTRNKTRPPGGYLGQWASPRAPRDRPRYDQARTCLDNTAQGNHRRAANRPSIWSVLHAISAKHRKRALDVPPGCLSSPVAPAIGAASLRELARPKRQEHPGVTTSCSCWPKPQVSGAGFREAVDGRTPST
jgi:hypothetical protein